MATIHTDHFTLLIFSFHCIGDIQAQLPFMAMHHAWLLQVPIMCKERNLTSWNTKQGQRLWGWADTQLEARDVIWLEKTKRLCHPYTHHSLILNGHFFWSCECVMSLESAYWRLKAMQIMATVEIQQTLIKAQLVPANLRLSDGWVQLK